MEEISLVKLPEFSSLGMDNPGSSSTDENLFDPQDIIYVQIRKLMKEIGLVKLQDVDLRRV